MIINDLDGYYIVFDTKNWNTELDTLIGYIMFDLLSFNLQFDVVYNIIEVWLFFSVFASLDHS